MWRIVSENEHSNATVVDLYESSSREGPLNNRETSSEAGCCPHEDAEDIGGINRRGLLIFSGQSVIYVRARGPLLAASARPPVAAAFCSLAKVRAAKIAI